jgi:hypothetical protein
MLADVIQKLAHEVAEDWANDALQFSAAEHLGRSFARQHPEEAAALLKTAMPLGPIARLTPKQKAIAGGISALGLAGLEAHNTLTQINDFQKVMKARKRLKERRMAQVPSTLGNVKTAGKLPPVKGGDALLAGLTSLGIGSMGKTKEVFRPPPRPSKGRRQRKVASELLKEALGIIGKGTLAVGGLGTIYAGKKTVDHLSKQHKQFQTRPYRHGQAGAAHFNVARQM